MGRSRPGGSTRRSRARRISHGFGARRRISTRTYHLGSTRRPRAGPPEVAVATRCATADSGVVWSVSKHYSLSSTCAPLIASRARASCSSEADVDVERHAGCYDGSCAMHSSRAASARRVRCGAGVVCVRCEGGAHRPRTAHPLTLSHLDFLILGLFGFSRIRTRIFSLWQVRARTSLMRERPWTH